MRGSKVLNVPHGVSVLMLGRAAWIPALDLGDQHLSAIVELGDPPVAWVGRVPGKHYDVMDL